MNRAAHALFVLRTHQRLAHVGTPSDGPPARRGQRITAQYLEATTSLVPHFISRIVPLLVVIFVAVLGHPAVSSAQVVGVPVNVDSFGNPFLQDGGFTRTVTRLPLPGTSTTPQGTFTQANSLGSMEMFGTGNGTSGITLSYTPTSGGAVDLTSQGSNGQLFVQFARIAGDRGLTMWIDVTDANGGKSRFAATGVGSVFAFNAAFPFTGFKGSADFRAISKVDFTFAYPATNTGGGWLQVDVNKLWATPISGAQPRPPSPAVTAPSTALGVAGAVVEFTVKFTNNEGAAPVTYGPPSAIGLRARDVDVTGTAFGGATPNVAVTGGPSTYKVAVSGMTRSGDIRVHVPEGVVDDGWLQLNTASANDPTVDFTFAIPPRFQSAANASFTVGDTGGFVADANAGQPVPVPTPRLSLISGSLPAGLTFTDNGNGTASITGKPAAGTGGVVPLTLRATNFAGTVTQNLTLTIYEAPSITSPAAVTFTAGSAGSATVRTGYDFPAETTLSIPAGSLPSGVAFADNGDGTATIAGTPTAGSGGRYTFDVTARNGVTPAAVQAFTLTVEEAPSITSADSVIFQTGTRGSVAVTTGHDYPTTTRLSIPDGSLPAGVAFKDNGDGTATISGTPETGSGGRYAFDITARNGITPAAVQSFELTVFEAPSITSADSVIFQTGTRGNVAVTTGHDYPTTTRLSIPDGSLPAGVAFKDNGDGTASLAGTPAAGSGGTYAFDITARNGITPAAVQKFTLTVFEPPSITSDATGTFTAGSRATFEVKTGHDYPTTTRLSIPDGSLPAGVGFKDNGDGTATISGTPETGSGGRYDFDITARNSITPAAVQAFTLIVKESPSITTAPAATFTVGSAGTFTVETGHDYPAPTSLSIPANQLPPGVVFQDNGDGTATLAGIPAAGSGGAHDFNITARNGVDPDAVQSFTLTVEGDAAPTPTATPTVAPTDTPGSATTTTPAATTPSPSGPAFGAPIVSDVSQTKPTWRTSGATAGTTFALTLSRAARLSFTFTRRAAGRKHKGRCVAPTRRNRHGRACRRTVRAGTLSLDGATGANRVPFKGLLDGGRRLRPGRHTLLISATDTATGQTSKLQRLRFTIVR